MGGDHIAISAFALFCEPFDEPGAIGDFASAFGQRLALFTAEQLAQILLVLHHQVKQAAHQSGPLASGFCAPCRQGSLCGINGARGFGLTHLWHAAQNFAGARIGDVKRGAAISIAPFAADIALLAKVLGIGHWGRPFGFVGACRADLGTFAKPARPGLSGWR